MNRENSITTSLQMALAPVWLEVINESSKHNVAPGSQTHFRVVVVSDAFAGLNRLARHRRIHHELAAELAGGLHALAIDAFSPQEWLARGERGKKSPDCLGGMKQESRAIS